MSGVVTQTLALSYMTWKTDWDQEVRFFFYISDGKKQARSSHTRVRVQVLKASSRLKRWYLKPREEDEHQSSDIHS